MADSTTLVSEIELARIRGYCEARIPDRVRDNVRLEVEVRGGSVTIVERRAPWTSSLGSEWTRSAIAQLRFDRARRDWALYWRGSDQRWHRYDRLERATHVDSLLAEIEADPTGTFWG